MPNRAFKEFIICRDLLSTSVLSFEQLSVVKNTSFFFSFIAKHVSDHSELFWYTNLGINF